MESWARSGSSAVCFDQAGFLANDAARIHSPILASAGARRAEPSKLQRTAEFRTLGVFVAENGVVGATPVGTQ